MLFFLPEFMVSRAGTKDLLQNGNLLKEPLILVLS